VARAQRYGRRLALVIVDLDDFKRVNDGYGHRAGDRVLAGVAVVLRHRLRESDIVARFGGDEFSVLMPVGRAPEAAELADLLVNAIHRDVPTPAGPLRASVGIAVFEELTTPDEILSRADDAMYANKGQTRPVRHLRSVE
jgi:diguanylate cyclase